MRIHDPLASSEEALTEYGVTLSPWDALPRADALVLAVAHQEYLSMPPASLLEKVRPDGCLIDVKSTLSSASVSAPALTVWRL